MDDVSAFDVDSLLVPDFDAITADETVRVARRRMEAETLRSLIVVDAERLFCSNDRCGGLRGRQLLYADDNHLSVEGSRLVAPLVVEALGL